MIQQVGEVLNVNYLFVMEFIRMRALSVMEREFVTYQTPAFVHQDGQDQNVKYQFVQD